MSPLVLLVAWLLMAAPAAAATYPPHLLAPEPPWEWDAGSNATCQQRRVALTQQCGTFSVPSLIINGRGSYPVQFPVVQGQLLGDVWTIPVYIVGAPKFELPQPDLVGSFVVWTCSPGIRVLQVRLPIRWELMVDRAKQLNKPDLAARMTDDALPGFLQWLLTGLRFDTCPVDALDLVVQTRRVLQQLAIQGRTALILDFYEEYMKSGSKVGR